MNKIDSYLNEVYVREELNLPKVDFKGFVNKSKKIVDEKDPKGSINRILKISPPGIKPSMLKTIDNYASSKYDKYDKMKNDTARIVKNSIEGVSPKMAQIAASYLVISSMFGKKNQQNMTHEAMLKTNIKEFVVKTRKFGEDYSDEEEEKKNKRLRPSDYADLSVAWVIVVMSTALAIGIGGGIYIFLKVIAIAIAASIGTVMTIMTWGLVIIVFTIVCAMIAGRLGLGG